MQFDTPISKHWQLAPGGSGLAQGVDDIDLCIHNILSTRKGSDVTRPDFGSNHFDYIDTPEDVFVPNIVREVVLAIQTWETRAVVDEVTFSGENLRLSAGFQSAIPKAFGINTEQLCFENTPCNSVVKSSS